MLRKALVAQVVPAEVLASVGSTASSVGLFGTVWGIYHALLQAEAAKTLQTELHIRGDKTVRYAFVMTAMAQARQAGIRQIAFISEPGRKHESPKH